MADALRGMITTSDLQTNEKDKNWRRLILERDPNGSVPLTALLSMMPTRTEATNPYAIWEEELSTQSGTVTSIYVESGLVTEYVYATHQATAGIAGGLVYAKVAAALANEFHAGHVVKLDDADQPDVAVVGHVTDVTVNGASSVIAIRLNEADDNHTTSSSYNLATVDTISIVGDAHEEGGEIPDPISYKPTEFSFNFQTFRTPVEISREQLQHQVRTNNDYQRRKGQALKYHMLEIENACLWGVPRQTTGPTSGKRLTFMSGIIPYIRTNASSNIVNFTTDTDYSGDSWITSGMTWLNKELKNVFKYGSRERVAFGGDDVMLAINELAQVYGDINVEVGVTEFGTKVNKWHTNFGSVTFHTHPLFSHNTVNTRQCLLVDKANLQYVAFKGADTHYKKDPNIRALSRGRSGAVAGFYNRDGIKEEWLTQCSLEIHHAKTHMFMQGFGSASAV